MARALEKCLVCYMIPILSHILDYNLNIVNRFFSKAQKGERSMVFEQVVEYCQNAGISISYFEKLCGIGNGAVGRWKGGHVFPSMGTLSKMEKTTGIPIQVWIGGGYR